MHIALLPGEHSPSAHQVCGCRACVGWPPLPGALGGGPKVPLPALPLDLSHRFPKRAPGHRRPLHRVPVRGDLPIRRPAVRKLHQHLLPGPSQTLLTMKPRPVPQHFVEPRAPGACSVMALGQGAPSPLGGTGWLPEQLCQLGTPRFLSRAPLVSMGLAPHARAQLGLATCPV